MSKRIAGLALFWIGGAYIFIASWLIMWWIAPIWRNTPAAEFEGTIWAFGGPIFMIIAMSVPVGIVLASVGMALYSNLGEAGFSKYVVLIIGLFILAGSVISMPTMEYYPNVFGIIGGFIVILFLLTLWYWARIRIDVGTDSHLADIFRLFGYICFFLTASTSCAMLGNPYGGLYFPETILQEASMPYYYSMGMKVALYLLFGWFFSFLGQYTRYRAVTSLGS